MPQALFGAPTGHASTGSTTSRIWGHEKFVHHSDRPLPSACGYQRYGGTGSKFQAARDLIDFRQCKCWTQASFSGNINRRTKLRRPSWTWG